MGKAAKPVIGAGEVDEDEISELEDGPLEVLAIVYRKVSSAEKQTPTWILTVEDVVGTVEEDDVVLKVLLAVYSKVRFAKVSDFDNNTHRGRARGSGRA